MRHVLDPWNDDIENMGEAERDRIVNVDESLVDECITRPELGAGSEGVSDVVNM